MAKAKILSTIGGRIRTVRRAHGDAQLDLAEQLGISRAAISQWESNETRPSTDMIDALVKFYGLNYEWLMHGRGKPPALPTAPLRRRLPRVREHQPLIGSETAVNFIVGAPHSVISDNNDGIINVTVIFANNRQQTFEITFDLAQKFCRALLALLERNQKPSN